MPFDFHCERETAPVPGDRRGALAPMFSDAAAKTDLYLSVDLDLNGVVENLTMMLLRMIAENISLSFLPATPIGSIKADPGQIEQILMNLAFSHHSVN